MTTLSATRGAAFAHPFDFKNEKGQAVAAPAGDYVLHLERGASVREFSLQRFRTGVVWNMTAEETQNLEYSTMYFVLNFNGQEIARGVLRVN